ncbi:MAG: TonB-dependent receptor [Candidatus Andeanibacterium colombiense]|uniref:TonB-dependent receptor n=1 Tax=Candidatus Andeanibacterium colombiense TaxID=3121345 RepID=A0AAJ5X3V7_9SPHN|nr:MAG: TonB-dependent receptor [Sphingomonadaceae bacterium]
MKTSYFAIAIALAGTATPVLAEEALAGASVEASDAPNEIIVTGEKISRSLQDTPTSVQVITSGDIQKQNLVDVYDAIDQTANVTSTFAKSGFTIRGIANTNVTGVGTGDLATVYLDGSPLPRTALSGPLDLWDVSQVEILRGPQSTLQGRNALAGAIIIKTADPTFEWSGKARVMLTDKDDERRFAAAIGGPIVEDQIAFRVAAEHSRADGFITNVTTDDEKAGFREGDMIRGKVLVTPGALPDLRIVASWLHDRHSSGVTYSLGLPGTGWDDRQTAGNRPTIDKTKSDIGTLDASYDLGGGFSLSSVTTWARIRTSNVYDGDNTAADDAYGDLSQDQRTLTEELRLDLDMGPVTGVFGGYYSRLNNMHDRSHSVFSLSPIDDLGLPDSIAPFYPARLHINTSQFYPQTVENLALFGDASWEVAPRLTLRGGFRYDSERQVRANSNAVTLITELPDPADFGPYAATITYVNGLILDQVAAANASSPAVKTKFEAFLPKFGATYEFSDDASLSATVQRGYRSGGSGVNPGRGALYTYDPEYTWNYELALRTQWLDRKLTLNANAFYIDWKQQQVNVQLSGNIYDYQTINAGSSRVYGFEVESRFQPSRGLSLYGSVGYTNTRFTDFTTTIGEVDDLTGNEFANAPHLTLAAGGTWESDAGWFVNLNANYRSAAYQEVLDQSTRQLKAHTVVNAKIGWKNEHFGAYLTATNIFDKKYFDYSYTNGAYQQYLWAEPRMLGLTLEAGF